MVLVVQLVPVVEALRTEKLLGGHAVPIEPDQQREPLLRPAGAQQQQWSVDLAMQSSRVKYAMDTIDNSDDDTLLRA